MKNKVEGPYLSIIVPVYKVEAYLNRCIDSILNQKYKNFELILVNDGSPDNSGVICEEYRKADDRVRVIHKKNGGLSSARNAGLEISRGEYIGFVDSDDWITTDMYSYLIEKAVEFNSDIVASSYILTKGDSFIKNKKETFKCFEGEEKLVFYFEYGMKYRVSDYTVCNKVYRRKLFEDIKFPEGQLYEDGVTNYKLIKKANKYIKSNKITYYYYQENESITRASFTMQDYDILLVGRQFIDLAIQENNDRLLELAKMKESRAYFSMLMKIAIYGCKDDVPDKNTVKNDLTMKLRSSYKLLLKSPMPLNRKFFMTLLCIDINLIRLPVSFIYKFIQRS